MNRQPIHKDNYEEYFLLYVDNELTSGEREAVEAFVLANPELKAELEMYLDTRLMPDTLAFEGKAALLMPEDAVHADNIEELQVQLLDGELDPVLAAKTLAYTQASDDAQQNFAWLKKARLPMEVIHFPHKASLYRHSEKPAAIISMRWIRIAAAAAVILAAGLWWLNQDSTPAGVLQPELAANGTPGTPSAGTPATGQISEYPANPAPSESGSTSSLAVTPSSGKTEQQQTSKGVAKEEMKHQPLKNQESVVTYASVDRTINTGQVSLVPEADAHENTITAPGLQPSQGTNPEAQEALALNVKTDYVTDALYREQSNPQEEFNGEEQRQRKGFRGLIRKVNRIYNKATNPDPEKATVKVANFEIGLPR